MLLSPAEDAPLKAIDFGMAVIFDPNDLPITGKAKEGE